MSLLFLFLKATTFTNFPYDWPVGIIIFQLDCLIFLRLVWTVRHWR